VGRDSVHQRALFCRSTLLGAGPRSIPRNKLSVERLAEAITTAVGDGDMRRRAAALGRRIRAKNGVQRAVELITGGDD